MCGIFGIIGKNYKKIENLFLEDLKHRGPDDDGTYLDNDKLLLLGHTRLSIIDISENGHQPMIDDTNNYVIVFNGEIYNFHEIKSELIKYGIKFRTNSDTEVVL
ncbi:MAG: asparagine synthetase B, partial [Bacteroidales bacterium]|nr:asparagine synthetase B [Bacteroidales bacterium]